MIFPLDLTSSSVAISALRSISEQQEEQMKLEQEKSGMAQKLDPLIEARISTSEELRESRGKIVAAMLSHQHVSVNEMVLSLADKLAEKLGIDMQQDRSYLMLGKVIAELVEKMDVGERRQLEEAVGLDELGVSLESFASALRDPTGASRDRLEEAFLKTAGRGGVTEATSRIVARLEDAADPQSIEEIKARQQERDPARNMDASGQQEQLEALKAAKAVANLKEIKTIQDQVADGSNARANETGPGKADDVLSLLAAIVDTARDGVPSEASDDAGGNGTSDDRRRREADDWASSGVIATPEDALPWL